MYIDDCCKLRNKIKLLLGAHIAVKLDLFHAVKMITGTLHKNHPHFHSCIEELRLVFRKDGDSGKNRMLDTPEPDIIKHKLDSFENKWKYVKDHHEIAVFTSKTTEAIRKLHSHISFGCLSNIPPGGGTNRNERLHLHLNSLFTISNGRQHSYSK